MGTGLYHTGAQVWAQGYIARAHRKNLFQRVWCSTWKSPRSMHQRADISDFGFSCATGARRRGIRGAVSEIHRQRYVLRPAGPRAYAKRQWPIIFKK
jgi:hypothetical protein